MGRWLSKEDVTSKKVTKCHSLPGFLCSHLFAHALSARLITQTAVSVVNELGTSPGPWYWLDEWIFPCEFATFSLKQRWIRIRCSNSSLLDSRIERESSSEFISVMSQAWRDLVIQWTEFCEVPTIEWPAHRIYKCSIGYMCWRCQISVFSSRPSRLFLCRAFKSRISSFLEQAISSGQDAVWPRPKSTYSI